ncbi:MAG: PorT family protein [Cyclobacteriaceae bacterium]|nr:PorT family protein [Cyclobacteriaceae bacterium]
MKKLLLILLLSGVALHGFTQCAQTLRLARATYEQGRLHEIESQLKGCLEPPEKGGFSQQENQLRVEALKILTMSYIYLEEPQRADAAMLSLKKADPYFRPNPEIDPAEFVALYNSFREEPIYRIGVRLGVNFTQPNVKEQVTVIELAEDSKYNKAVAFQFGAAMDVPLTLLKQAKKWTLHGELLYQQRKFTIVQNEDRGVDPAEPGNKLFNRFEGAETQVALSLPITLEYKFLNKKYNPYVAAGASTDYLFRSSLSAERKRLNEPGVPEQSLDLKRQPINLSALAAMGVKLPVGPGLIVFEIRYAHGLTNVSSRESAFENEALALDYGYADPVFRQSSISIAGSYIFNIHNPKKITHRK